MRISPPHAGHRRRSGRKMRSRSGVLDWRLAIAPLQLDCKPNRPSLPDSKLCRRSFFRRYSQPHRVYGVADQLGGDALNGRVEAGRYYLGSHGRLTEVSRDVFTYSWWHPISLMVTQPLALLAGWCAAKFDQL